MWNHNQQQSGEQSASQGTSEQPYIVATSATPVHPPPPQQLNTPNVYSTVPPGWTTSIDPADGRIYYLEVARGRTSWTHPHATSTSRNGNYGSAAAFVPQTTDQGRTLNPFHPRSWNPFRRNNNYQPQHLANNTNGTTPPATDPLGNPLDTPLNARNRPDTNQCYAFTSLLLCPPIGIIAMYHSMMCDRAWNQGQYSDAVRHAREGPKFANFACFVGIIFWASHKY